jgi:hypothetical protein
MMAARAALEKERAYPKCKEECTWRRTTCPGEGNTWAKCEEYKKFCMSQCGPGPKAPAPLSATQQLQANRERAARGGY